MDDSIHNLPPKERVEALRRMREKKQRELEELERKRKQEMQEAEEELQESLEDLEEEEENKLEERLNQLRAQLDEMEEEEQSLEEAVQGEEYAQQENSGYFIPQEQANAYTPINQIVEDLNRLQYSSGWGPQEQDLYQQRKTELQQTLQYKNTLGDELLEQVDTAQNILKKLGYQGHQF